MLSPNLIFLWIACLSGCVNLFYALKTRAWDWVGISIFLLLLSGAGSLWWWEWAGYVAGGFWLVFIIIPTLVGKVISQKSMRQQYDQALRWSYVLYWMHPTPNFRNNIITCKSMLALQQGDFDESKRLLESIVSKETSPGQYSTYMLYYQHGHWQELLSWLTEHYPPEKLRRDGSMVLILIRTLGEIGQPGRMIDTYQQYKPILQSRIYRSIRANCLLFLLAFCGEKAGVGKVIAGTLRDYNDTIQKYWLATADFVNGDETTYRNTLTQLRDTTSDMAMKHRIQLRLEQPGLVPIEGLLTPSQQAIVQEMVDELQQAHAYRAPVSQSSKRATATWVLIVLNLLFFIAEWPGGSEDPHNLYNLGAILLPFSLDKGEWWRIITANFLHFGPVHLILNMIALQYFGKFTESVLGSVRFLAVYLLCGLGSVALYGWGITELVHALPSATLEEWSIPSVQILVGASGGVMGLVGSHGGIALKRYLSQHYTRLSKRHLLSIGLIFGLQSIFDFITPHVAFLVHFMGFLIGILTGYLLLPVPKNEAEPNT